MKEELKQYLKSELAISIGTMASNRKFLTKEAMEKTEDEQDLFQRAIQWLESLPDLEPLDPYTCDLMVGDVTMVDNMEKCVIIDIENVGWWVCMQKSGHAFLVRKRGAIKLISRNGAVIKEVGK